MYRSLHSWYLRYFKFHNVHSSTTKNALFIHKAFFVVKECFVVQMKHYLLVIYKAMWFHASLNNHSHSRHTILINHPSQYEVQHWIAFITTHTCFEDGWEKVTLLQFVCKYIQTSPDDIMEILTMGCIQSLPITELNYTRAIYFMHVGYVQCVLNMNPGEWP